MAAAVGTLPGVKRFSELPKLQLEGSQGMDERRQEHRVHVELRVKVSGADACCENFAEHAIATNISRSGALLSHIHSELRCGDLVAVEYGGRRAQYRIVWVLDSEGESGTRIAIHRVGNRPCPWEELLIGETVGY